MSIIILAAAQALVPGGEAAEEEEILVTAARIPVAQEEIGVSATLFGEARIEALGLDDAADFLRLMPGVDVAATGARGTQTQVRVRGAEANHTLLFVDGIRFNDPAAGNEPRFEILTADGLARIELVRGPQSALWGSEAIGGVIALSSPDPLGPGRTSLAAEYGGDESLRAAVGAVLGGDTLG
ncbi:MAG: TonB-dependent receptor, partial [Sphingomonadaceae bacterium]